MNERYVPVISMSRSTVVLTLPDYHYERTWPRKGAKLMIDKEILVNSFYQPGVERLFREGFLFIDDQKVRIEVGLEVEPIAGDDVAPSEYIVLDEKMLNRITNLMPNSEAALTIQKLSPNQKNELVDYIVSHNESLNMAKIQMISQECGVDILKAIELKKEMEA